MIHRCARFVHLRQIVVRSLLETIRSVGQNCLDAAKVLAAVSQLAADTGERASARQRRRCVRVVVLASGPFAMRVCCRPFL